MEGGQDRALDHRPAESHHGRHPSGCARGFARGRAGWKGGVLGSPCPGLHSSGRGRWEDGGGSKLQVVSWKSETPTMKPYAIRAIRGFRSEASPTHGCHGVLVRLPVTITHGSHFRTAPGSLSSNINPGIRGHPLLLWSRSQKNHGFTKDLRPLRHLVVPIL